MLLDSVNGHYALLSGVAAACGLYTLYRKYSRISISDVPGPESNSFLLGVFVASSGSGFLVDVINQVIVKNCFLQIAG